MSVDEMPPELLRSYLKLLPLTTWPDRPLTSRMSLEVTERVLFTSPTRNPSEADQFVPAPFTFVSETVTRLLSGIPVRTTVTSLPEKVAEALPMGAALESTTAAVPVAV